VRAKEMESIRNDTACWTGIHDAAAEATGDRLRMIDVVELPLIPFFYPERLLHLHRRSGIGRYTTSAKGPRIPRERWPEVAASVEREGLRSVARSLGVSHETVRAAVKRVRQEGAASLFRRARSCSGLDRNPACRCDQRPQSSIPRHARSF
jgi:hypothetical protein